MFVRKGQRLGSVLNSPAEVSTGPAGQLTDIEQEADRQAAAARDAMAAEPQAQRPPTSGPGSGAPAWREYAAATTGTSIEEWAGLGRDEIIELLDDPEVSDDDDALSA